MMRSSSTSVLPLKSSLRRADSADAIQRRGGTSSLTPPRTQSNEFAPLTVQAYPLESIAFTKLGAIDESHYDEATSRLELSGGQFYQEHQQQFYSYGSTHSPAPAVPGLFQRHTPSYPARTSPYGFPAPISENSSPEPEVERMMGFDRSSGLNREMHLHQQQQPPPQLLHQLQLSQTSVPPQHAPYHPGYPAQPPHHLPPSQYSLPQPSHPLASLQQLQQFPYGQPYPVGRGGEVEQVNFPLLYHHTDEEQGYITDQALGDFKLRSHLSDGHYPSDFLPSQGLAFQQQSLE